MSAPPAGPAEARSIFISYAGLDPQWPAEQVAALASRLRNAGATVFLDQWAEHDRGRRASDDEWRGWMRSSLAAARHVLCLSSDRYADLCERRSDADRQGRGVAFESFALEQWLYNGKQGNDGRIWICKPAPAPVPGYLDGKCPVYEWPFDVDHLVAHLCRPDAGSQLDALHRRMRTLIDDELVDLYVPLSGRVQKDRLARMRMPQSTRRRLLQHPQDLHQHVSSEHADLLEVVRADTRALLLGEPGAGKTFALLKVMQGDLEVGITPLWVKLNHWLDATASFEHFVAGEVPDLGASWAQQLASRRCRLLIDGLNELPAEHAAKQIEQIDAWLQAHPDCPVLLSCREDDLPVQAFACLRERLTVRPLRARQIRQFVHLYIVEDPTADAAAADALFWHLAGGHAFDTAWASRPPDTPDACLDDLVDGSGMQGVGWLSPESVAALAAARADPSWPYPMATNPYMLAMLVWVWCEDEGGGRDTSVPRRRVDIFSRYTRERLCAEVEKRHSPLDADAVQHALAALAAAMQHVAERSDKGRDAGVLAIDRSDIDEAQWPALQVALGARLLRQEGALLRFRHQLLHEFYVARFLHDRLAEGGAALLQHVWGEDQPLWQRAGWVQPFLLLAEYQHTDVEALLRALLDIQPEVAGAVWAQTRRLKPALLTAGLADDVARHLTARMLPEPPSAEFPQHEAAFGRGLGLMRLPDGRPLDRRPGVWGWFDARLQRAEVDIDWVRIPAGPFVYQGEPARIEHDFLISRHPITHSQFQAFVDDPGGWTDARWWGDAPAEERERPWAPEWPYGNHPCTDVSWWAARAFCRWMSALRNEAVALPSELQWERAAASVSGADYPWQGDWSDACANADVNVGQTTPAGLYSGGCSPEGVHDLAGNVWEWTDTLYTDTADRSPAGDDDSARRAVRGGSWYDHTDDCRAGCRYWITPVDRSDDLGFRVVCCPIPGP